MRTQCGDAVIEVLNLVEAMLQAVVSGGDDMVPVESVSRIRRICQTQREMIELGLLDKE